MARQREYSPDGKEIYTDLPVIFTPLTTMTDHWGTAQKGPCAARELDWAQCAAAVGQKRATKECREYMSDFLECTQGNKAIKRWNAIQAERKKQGLAPQKPPAKDSVWTWQSIQ